MVGRPLLITEQIFFNKANVFVCTYFEKHVDEKICTAFIVNSALHNCKCCSSWLAVAMLIVAVLTTHALDLFICDAALIQVVLFSL